MKKIIILSVFLLAMLMACSEKTRKVILNSSNMENTFLFTDKVEISNKREIEYNDFVVMQRYDTLEKVEKFSAYRVIGVPGDVISIDSNKVMVNGKYIDRPGTRLSLYDIKYDKGEMPAYLFKSSFIKCDTFARSPLTDSEYHDLLSDPTVKSIHEVLVPPYENNEQVDSQFDFFLRFHSFMKPVRIPKVGEQLDKALPIPLKGNANHVGTRIAQKYYFLLNDNNTGFSSDSRDFGLVPRGAIMGVIKKFEHTAIYGTWQTNVDTPASK